jgi:hypothetical protein
VVTAVVRLSLTRKLLTKMWSMSSLRPRYTREKRCSGGMSLAAQRGRFRCSSVERVGGEACPLVFVGGGEAAREGE